MNAENLQYLESHEWVAVDEINGQSVATVGISAFAVEQLGDVVHIELPAVGTAVTAGQEFGEVESVKAVSSLYSPVTGEVVEVNEAVASDPAVLGDDPYARGWIMKVQVAELSSDLMDYDRYQKQCESH